MDWWRKQGEEKVWQRIQRRHQQRRRHTIEGDNGDAVGRRSKRRENEGKKEREHMKERNKESRMKRKGQL